MALTCSPLELLDSACNVKNASPDQKILIKLAILCRWVNGNTASCDVPTLLAEACANRFNWLSKFQAKLVEIMLLCQIAGHPPPPQCDLTTDLVGWWKMEEASNTSRTDSSGNGNTLADSGSDVGQVAGMIGKAADFTHVGSQALIGTTSASVRLGATDPFTIAFWVNLNSNVSGTLFDLRGPAFNNNNFSVTISSTGRFVLNFAGASPGLGGGASLVANSYGVIPTGQWIFLLGEVNPSAGTAMLRINDSNEDNFSGGAFTNGYAGADSFVEIGNGTLLGVANAKIDEVRYYKNRLLTPTEQTCLFNFRG